MRCAADVVSYIHSSTSGGVALGLSGMSAMRSCSGSVATASSNGLHDIAGTGHLNRGFDGILQIVRVVSRRFVSIAEVHAIVARAHLAQSEPEMARN